MYKCRSLFQGSVTLRRNFVSVAKKKELNDVLLLVPRKPSRLTPKRLMATEYVGGIGKYGNVLVIGGILGFVGVSAYIYKFDLITLGLPPDQNSVAKPLTTDRFSTQSDSPGPSRVQPLTSTPTQGSSSLASAAKKRDNYLDWDEYFMAVAVLSAQRSKDPISQVGACIVNEEKIIVGTGYNGMPNRCDDDKLPWGKEGALLDKKHPYVCHAEMNAIMNKNSSDVKDCTIYVVLFPCNECAKLIIQSGIRKIVFLSDKHHEKPATIASKKMLDMAKVEYVKYIPKQHKIEIDFFAIDPNSRPEQMSSITSP